MSEYRGRFAPSPTGKLHFGSLVTAMASYADAKSNNGSWSIRIDDIDSPRVVPDSAKQIITKLERLGFQWDGPITWQSAYLNNYHQAIEQLEKNKQIYGCACSRKEIKALSNSGIYPGTCRNGLKKGKTSRLKRLNTTDINISFIDQIQGYQDYSLASNAGDFIIYRADAIVAYQLAVVVDDFLAQVTHVVRGIDLLDSTPKQIFLQQLLQYPTPNYAHIPLMVDKNNQKLGKKTQAPEVADDMPTLLAAAKTLGQELQTDISDATKEEFWQELIKNWQISAIPKTPEISILLPKLLLL